jgi:hypothetical protein
VYQAVEESGEGADEQYGEAHPDHREQMFHGKSAVASVCSVQQGDRDHYRNIAGQGCDKGTGREQTLFLFREGAAALAMGEI